MRTSGSLALLGIAVLACGPDRPGTHGLDGGVHATAGGAGQGPGGSLGAGGRTLDSGVAGSASGGRSGVMDASAGKPSVDPGVSSRFPQKDPEDAGPITPFVWDLPHGFQVPLVPADNPMTNEKVTLGRYLFFDTRLSINGTQSCATCHDPARAFTDGRARGLGSTGELHSRSPMSLVNVAYAVTLTWENPNMTELEAQAKVPLFGTNPIELGMGGHEDELLERFSGVPIYEYLFARAFPGDATPITVDNLTRAIASFERTIFSGGSRYDRDVIGQDFTALTDSEARGLSLFNEDGPNCFHCHSGTSLSTPSRSVGQPPQNEVFFNTALYNVDGKGAYPAASQGIIDVTHQAPDMGKFKPPTLRNIAVTAPYMHDGSIATLDAVLDHYTAGGRMIASGPNAGDGSKNPYRSEFVRGFTLSAQDRIDLIAFLESLTDTDFLDDPRYKDPWPSYRDAH